MRNAISAIDCKDSSFLGLFKLFEIIKIKGELILREVDIIKKH